MSWVDGGAIGELNYGAMRSRHFVGAKHGGSQEVAGAAGVGDFAAVVLVGVGGN